MDLSVLMHMIKFLSYKIIDVNIMGGLRVSNTSSVNDVISFIRGTESLTTHNTKLLVLQTSISQKVIACIGNK